MMGYKNLKRCLFFGVGTVVQMSPMIREANLGDAPASNAAEHVSEVRVINPETGALCKQTLFYAQHGGLEVRLGDKYPVDELFVGVIGRRECVISGDINALGGGNEVKIPKEAKRVVIVTSNGAPQVMVCSNDEDDCLYCRKDRELPMPDKMTGEVYCKMCVDHRSHHQKISFDLGSDSIYPQTLRLFNCEIDDVHVIQTVDLHFYDDGTVKVVGEAPSGEMA